MPRAKEIFPYVILGTRARGSPAWSRLSQRQKHRKDDLTTNVQNVCINGSKLNSYGYASPNLMAISRTMLRLSLQPAARSTFVKRVSTIKHHKLCSWLYHLLLFWHMRPANQPTITGVARCQKCWIHVM